MFTGIITDLGLVRRVEYGAGGARFEFDTHYDTTTIIVGASIACNGCCLTVIAHGSGWFAIQASAATLASTTLSHWHPGMLINLERALRIGDELGGHIIFGHVDGTAEVVTVRPDGDSRCLTVALPPELVRYAVTKGSIALDGVSLTINGVDEEGFSVNIIPYTQIMTTLSLLQPGDHLNVEIDMLARYVARLFGKD